MASSLILNKGNIWQIGAKGAEFMSDMLRYNTTISTLDLRANGLRDEVGCCCQSQCHYEIWILSLLVLLIELALHLFTGCSLSSSQYESGQ